MIQHWLRLTDENGQFLLILTDLNMFFVNKGPNKSFCFVTV